MGEVLAGVAGGVEDAGAEEGFGALPSPGVPDDGIYDAHEGLKKAIAAAMPGASWQRCRVRFARNRLAAVKKTLTGANITQLAIPNGVTSIDTAAPKTA